MCVFQFNPESPIKKGDESYIENPTFAQINQLVSERVSSYIIFRISAMWVGLKFMKSYVCNAISIYYTYIGPNECTSDLRIILQKYCKHAQRSL